MIHNSDSKEVFVCVYNLEDVPELKKFLGSLYDPNKVIQKYKQHWNRITMVHSTHGYAHINFVWFLKIIYILDK